MKSHTATRGQIQGTNLVRLNAKFLSPPPPPPFPRRPSGSGLTSHSKWGWHILQQLTPSRRVASDLDGDPLPPLPWEIQLQHPPASGSAKGAQATSRPHSGIPRPIKQVSVCTRQVDWYELCRVSFNVPLILPLNNFPWKRCGCHQRKCQLVPQAFHLTPGASSRQGSGLCQAGRGLPWCPSPITPSSGSWLRAGQWSQNSWAQNPAV